MKIFANNSAQAHLRQLLWMLSLLLVCYQLLVGWRDIQIYGGCDLRNRIVGSRLMMHGKDAYFTLWQPGMPLDLCDPNESYSRPMNGVTCTPAILFTQIPLASVKYPQIRILWWFAQQLLLFGIAFVIMFSYGLPLRKAVYLFFALSIFTLLPYWQIHNERGQMYMVYAAWIAILLAAWRLLQSKQFYVPFIAVYLLVGFLIRPPLIVFALPTFFMLPMPHRKKFIIYNIGAAVVAVLSILSNWQWQSYFEAMRLYTAHALGNITWTPLPKPNMPAIIEGVINIKAISTQPQTVRYVGSLHYFLNKFGLKVHNPTTFALIFVALSFPLLIYAIVRQRTLNTIQWLSLGCLLYWIAEICIPMRMAYNVVQWLPLVLGIAVHYSKTLGEPTAKLPDSS